jgi:hypothetical protein
MKGLIDRLQHHQHQVIDGYIGAACEVEVG